MKLAIKLIFATAMTVSGFLLFQVQPMIAKFILPWFGGSATTWTVCMLFFQIALLLGYAYAHAVTVPLSIRSQALAQMAVMALSLFFLPITPSDTWKPADSFDPTGRILLLLTVSVGAPYVVLSTTSPLLQRWLAHTDRDMLTSRFFALSNFGSFLGLLSYPFIFERIWSSPQQTYWWSWSYVGFALLVCLASCLVLKLSRTTVSESHKVPEKPSATARDRADLWVFYSALGSTLLLATTNQISQWTAVLPFLWILPLSLYLLTFVIVFGHQSFYRRMEAGVAFAVLMGLMVLWVDPDSNAPLALQVLIEALTMFVGCLICHGEMVRLQPSAARLPLFYLSTAFGGALGGLFVTFIAPLLFKDYFEFPISLAIAGLVVFRLAWKRVQGARRIVAAASACAFACALTYSAYGIVQQEQSVVDRIRNFYGVVKVVREDEDDPDLASLGMVQAGVEQGSQYLSPAKKMTPYCAFLPQSGIGRALANVRKRREGGPEVPLRIGSVGLGVGVLAALGKTGDAIRVYELNPAVTELAMRHFTFVRDSKAKVDIFHGDGRILLERELRAGQPQNFDVLVVDAFRGASPPLHLMTAEAFQIYLAHLAPDGILAINFENDTFEMSPLHRGLAAHFGLKVGWFETPNVADDCDGAVSWALYSRDEGFFNAPGVTSGLSPWRDGSDSRILWTDANANLMSIVSWDKVLESSR